MAFILALTFAAGGWASGGSDKGQVLLGLVQPSAWNAAKAVRGMGVVTGTDLASGMYIVKLPAGQKVDSAIARLRKEPGVSAVLPFSARLVDPCSYHSIDLHLKYLQAAEDLSGKDEDTDSKGKHVVHDKGDFYDALRYYMRRRIAVGSDHIDVTTRHLAEEHVHRMPVARIGSGRIMSPSIPATPTAGWTFLGPNNLPVPYQIYYGTSPLSGRISCIAYDPTVATTIYAGSGGGGLWKSVDGGTTWNCVSDKAPWKYPAVDCIAIDPTNHNTLYVGTGDFDGFFNAYNQGIMKSTDGGATWTNLATTVTGIYDLSVSRIVIDPENDQLITCTTGRGSYSGPNQGTGNVFRSTNGGTTWASAGLAASDYSALDVSAKDGSGNRTYWAAGASTTGDGLLYKSTNRGATWTSVAAPDSATEIAWSLACSKVSPSTVYVVATGSNSVYKTTNSGTSWTNITSGMPGPALGEDNWSQSSYDYFISTYAAPQASSGEVVFCGLITLAYSLNGGAGWTDYGETYQTSAIMHNDQHQFAVSASDGSQVLVGNDGGLFQLQFSWSGGVPGISMHPLNANLGITQMYFIAPHPTDPTQLLGGAQDNACPASLGDFTTWTNLGGGDGGYCGWDLAKNLLYVTADEGTVYLYDTTGNNVNVISEGFNSGVGFLAPTVVSTNGSIMYLGTTTVMRANLDSGSPSFVNGTQTLADVNNEDFVNVISTAPSDVQRIYTSSAEGWFWESNNAGSTWTRINSAALPQDAVISAISPSPSVEADVLVGYQNTGVLHLWRTTNIDAANPTWVSASGSGAGALPDSPLNAILRDPYNPTQIWYVGTDIGVFMTQNAGSSWTNVTAGLPETQVFDLKYGAGYIYAGTFGRGVWRIALPDPIASLTLAASTVTAGIADTATLKLAAAPALAMTVSLSSSSSAATVPPSVTLPAGASSGSFLVNTNTVTAATSATITATNDQFTKSVTLTIQPGDPVSGITLSSATVEGGSPVTCTVTLGKAFSTSVTVKTTSSSSSATLPSVVTYAAGTTSHAFTINTSAVTATTSATISASSDGVTKSAVLTINAPDPVAAIAMAHPTATTGVADNCTVALSHAAPTGGISVSLVSSNTAVVPLPVTSPFVFPAGHTSEVFTLTPYSVTSNTSVTITATAEGVSKSTTVVVAPAAVELTAASAVVGGNVVTATVHLAASASSATAVSISSNSSSATAPASISIPAGSLSGAFNISTKGVDANTPFVITISASGVTQSRPMTITPADLFTFAIAPISVAGGTNSDGVIHLNGQAGPSGTVVTITSSSPYATVQSAVRVAAGATTASFPIKTTAPSSIRTVVITVTLGSTALTGKLNVTP